MDRKMPSEAVATLMGLAAGIVISRWYRRRSDQRPEAEALTSFTILGDIFCDILVKTDSDILPQWGGDVVVGSPVELQAGGSGLNTATHLSSSFNMPTRLWSSIGHDMWGTVVRSHAQKAGVQLSCLSRGSTGVCVVISGKRDRCFLTHRGPIATLALSKEGEASSNESISADALLRTTAHGGHIHVAGYYNCPKLWGAPTQRLLTRARNGGFSTSLGTQFDASGAWGHLGSELLSQVDVLLVSQDEASAIAHIDPDGEAAVEQAAHWFLDHGVRIAVITLGAQGALALVGDDGMEPGVTHNGRTLLRQPIALVATSEGVIDTTGAGDAFSAGFLYGWRKTLEASGASLSLPYEGTEIMINAVREGLRYGVAAGSSCVGTLGAACLMDRTQIERLVPK